MTTIPTSGASDGGQAEPVIGRAFARPDGFAHPTDGALICLARKRNLGASLRQINTTGKSLLIFRNRVKSRNQKYSASREGQINRITPPVSRQMRDARDRHERAVRCDGRERRETYAPDAYGEVVWS